MNLWLRLLLVAFSTLLRPRITSPLGVSSITLMVLPNDLDVNLHVNNGRYLTLMDLGRLDLFIRAGLLRAIKGTAWMPVLGAATIRFRREMRLWRRFRVETRLVYWEDTRFVMEHRVITRGRSGEKIIAAVSLNVGGLYDREGKRFVPVAEVAARMNISGQSPPATSAVRAFLDANTAIRAAG